ncbi:MAG: DUF1134 domain-containing protein [Rhodospirillales bacterium]
MIFSRFFAVLTAALLLAASPAVAADDETFTKDEILSKTRGFFGDTTEGLAEAVEKAFADNGRPNAYIIGEEASGAIGVGLRYGEGILTLKSGEKSEIYWQGPSIGFDFGGNASKVFTLIYNLQSVDHIFQRIPGVDGSAYFVAGVGMNYQQSANLILAPIRTGIGLRGGVNIGYLHYSREHSWIPF